MSLNRWRRIPDIGASGTLVQRAGLDQQVSKVLSHHPLRAMFGGINADNGKFLSAGLLNTRANDAVRLLYRLKTAGLRLKFFPAGPSNVVRHLKSPEGGTVKAWT